ncbi:MAG: phosphatase PAP2 family protein [Stomatobaculum sp.]
MNYRKLYLLIRKRPFLCCGLYTLFYLSWFRFLERTVTAASHYHVIHCGLDDLIPFVPAFIIPYLLWFFYVLGILLFLGKKDADEMTRLCIFLASGMSICLLICTLYHNGTDFRVSADPSDGIYSALTWLIQRADTPTNVFPSIHVYNAFGVNAAVWHSRFFARRPALRVASALLMLSICCSTVFLKQHSLIDVAGAMVLAYFMDVAVYGHVPVPVLGVPVQKKKLTHPA